MPLPNFQNAILSVVLDGALQDFDEADRIKNVSHRDNEKAPLVADEPEQSDLLRDPYLSPQNWPLVHFMDR